jgi:hypothetical protein
MLRSVHGLQHHPVPHIRMPLQFRAADGRLLDADKHLAADLDERSINKTRHILGRAEKNNLRAANGRWKLSLQLRGREGIQLTMA